MMIRTLRASYSHVKKARKNYDALIARIDDPATTGGTLTLAEARQMAQALVDEHKAFDPDNAPE